MHPHTEVLTRLFTALDRHDHEAMAACYAENASFRDIAFKLEGRTRIHAMWHMICDGDIKTTFKIDEVDDRTAFVTVVDDYTFRAKGRKVHNVIQSRFRFKDGAIVEQQDSCDSRQWASMAIGGVGGFLAGRIPLPARREGPAHARHLHRDAIRSTRRAEGRTARRLGNSSLALECHVLRPVDARGSTVSPVPHGSPTRGSS